MHQQFTIIQFITARLISDTNHLLSTAADRQVYIVEPRALRKRRAGVSRLPDQTTNTLSELVPDSIVARRAHANRSLWNRQCRISWKWLGATSLREGMTINDLSFH